MKDWTIWQEDDFVRHLAQPGSIKHAFLPPCLFLCTKDDTIPMEDYQQLKHNCLQAMEKTTSTHNKCHVVIMEEGGHGPFFGSTANAYFEHIHNFLLQADIM
jgi:hypothetical protein